LPPIPAVRLCATDQDDVLLARRTWEAPNGKWPASSFLVFRFQFSVSIPGLPLAARAPEVDGMAADETRRMAEQFEDEGGPERGIGEVGDEFDEDEDEDLDEEEDDEEEEDLQSSSQDIDGGRALTSEIGKGPRT
jgi:hypothetical protein